jgi:anthranilate/para-aminobenzoate synthase component I
MPPLGAGAAVHADADADARAAAIAVQFLSWCVVVLLLQGHLLAYAGVGVVAASEVAAEWQELCLKVRQLTACLLELESSDYFC